MLRAGDHHGHHGDHDGHHGHHDHGDDNARYLEYKCFHLSILTRRANLIS